MDYSFVLGVFRVNILISNGLGFVLYVVIGCLLRNSGLLVQYSVRVSNLVDFKFYLEFS